MKPCIYCLWQTWTSCRNCKTIVCLGCSPAGSLCKPCYEDPDVPNFINRLGKRKRKTEKSVPENARQCSPSQPKASVLQPQKQPSRPHPTATNKVVVKGPLFWEHTYNNFEESFIGQWAKVGTLVDFSEAAQVLLNCNSCVRDRKARNAWFPISEPLRSYQVPGFTNNEDLWRWENGQCDNKVSIDTFFGWWLVV